VYASGTGLQRSAVVQQLNDSLKDEPKADIYIRSHAHESFIIRRRLMSALITPCLQFSGSAYGRKCTGFYDYGLTYIDIENKTDFQIYTKFLEHASGKNQEILKL
jgi:hypothetical protein